LQGFGIKQDVPTDANECPREDCQSADLEADPNYERRKRQKTASPGAEGTAAGEQHTPAPVVSDPGDRPEVGLDWRGQLEVEAAESDPKTTPANEVGSRSTEHDNDRLDIPSIPALPEERPVIQASVSKSEDEKARLGRTMRLTGGKLASPTVKKHETPQTPKRDRRRKAPAASSYIVKLAYGKNSSDAQEMGRRIQRILDGEMNLTLPLQKELVKPAPLSAGPPKSTHPFFTGKAKNPKPPTTVTESATSSENAPGQQPKPSPRKASTTTPGKLRTQRNAFRMPDSPSFKCAEPIARPKLKHEGDHPAWPTRESMHVRGPLELPEHPLFDLRSVGFAHKSAKRKQELSLTNILEDVLPTLASITDHDLKPLRKPTKVVTTGAGIQQVVSERLASNIASPKSHPACRAMFSSIDAALSAFDRYECEIQAWTQKYAPASAAEVLQTGSEAYVLKDWLQRSTITAVQTSSKRSTASSTISTTKAKLKRKRKDHDDFIVGSDDELDDLNELLPLTDPARAPGVQKSFARGGDDYTRSTPASSVLLSGPHGCGKTAAVYAVAKELGFEVFEINSASRRSGKDVLDRIGDMTENHLVQQVSKALTEEKAATVNGKMEAIKIDQPDVLDPKQKSMASFFKAGPTVKKTSTTSNTMQKSIAKVKTESKPQSRQKQSLILLEEVDVLFEEDKQFWLTILTLAVHSKRPIIMTCNDERYVPEALDFHAILRFVAPPADLAVDYLLLLAAREGHILQRGAVESLYKTKNCDLRGSISEMNFWCQMAVGDPTRGFNWTLDRYPPGVDVDNDGRTLRTASEDTFIRGMNVITYDLAQCSLSSMAAAEDVWSCAWDEWTVDALAAPHDALTLDTLLERLDIVSAGDISFGLSMREPQQQRIDPTQPELRAKTVSSYALGWTGLPNPLQVEPVTDYATFDKKLAVSSHLGVRNFTAEPQPQLSSQIVIDAVEAKKSTHSQHLDRTNFSHALDVFASDPEDPSPTNAITMSSFDREFRIITTDLAPYLRTIAREFQGREEERLRMSNLLSAGGRKRQTRNAFAAMDGGRRGERKARYFETWRKMGVDASEVLGTGGEGWSCCAVEGTGTATESLMGEEDGSLKGTQESEEVL